MPSTLPNNPPEFWEYMPIKILNEIGIYTY